jgi:hypothetical protein
VTGETAADSLRPLLYGDAALDQWPPESGGHHEPWTSFEQARDAFGAGLLNQAYELWRRIALDEDAESRCRLQAWHFLRQAGQEVPNGEAKHVLGAIIEAPVAGSHDVLAAYEDGSARYLNYSGKVVIWDERANQDVLDAIRGWLAVASVIANHAGPWTDLGFPPLPAGNMRIMALTPSGPHFGQGPSDALLQDEIALRFQEAATRLLTKILPT